MNMEKIHYVNVCSLYPYILKTSTFPLGQPTIYIGEQCSELIGVASNFNLDSVEDIIRCTVLPRDLFHPIFLYRIQGKLLFGLCRSCCETFSQAECIHDLPADRRCMGILRIAQSPRERLSRDECERKSYTIRSLYEASFVCRIYQFLKLKQEGSGWPSECQDVERNGTFRNTKKLRVLFSIEIISFEILVYEILLEFFLG